MKLQKISDIRPTLVFSEYDFIQKYRDSFKNSELGRIYDQLPLRESHLRYPTDIKLLWKCCEWQNAN